MMHLAFQPPAFCTYCPIFPPLLPPEVVGVGTLRVGLLAVTHAWMLHRFNKLAVGSVVESAFRKLKHLQVLDIEGNFEFGDVSKDHGHLKEEDEEEEDETR